MQPDWLPGRARQRVRITVRLVVGLAFGLLLGLVVGLAFGLDAGLLGGLVIGLFIGLVVGLFGRDLDSVKPIEILKWSWAGVAKRLVVGLGGDLDSVKPIEALKWSWAGVSKRLAFRLVAGLVAGLLTWLAGGLAGGLDVVAVDSKTTPNQGIRQSVRNALTVELLAGLVVWLFYGLVFGLLAGLLGGLVAGLLGWLVSGLFGVLAGGLAYGGTAVILHCTLRFFLQRNNYLPWNLVRFLDYTAERILLRKVGGGYIFIHRLLQDYFASLYHGEEGAT